MVSLRYPKFWKRWDNFTNKSLSGIIILMDNQYQNFRSLTLKQITYALAAADEGNVTAAARKLHISQPAVSAAIAALESHYELKLFTRHPAEGVALTPFGIKVMSEARLLCDQAQTVAMLATPDAKIAGEVGLCCYEAIAPFVVPRLLRHLEQHLPAVTVRFSESDLEHTVASLKNGSVDLAITYDLGLEGDIYQQVLYSLQPQVICSERHKFSRVKSLRLSELHREKLILLDQPLSAQYVLGLLRAHRAEPEVVLRAKSFELQRSLVANDFGMALVHTIPKTSLSYDGQPICSTPIADELIEQRVLLTCLAQNRKRPVLESILTEAATLFSDTSLANP
jgi:DNA-binding transcriptional LysR family regulator